MAGAPKTPVEAVALFGLAEGATVIAVSPAPGWPEAFVGAVGESGRVTVVDPPEEMEASDRLDVVEALSEDAVADAVVVWLGPVPAHELRAYAKHVTPSGALWVVLPRTKQGNVPAVKEADVRRTLLARGLHEGRPVSVSSDAYAIRYRRR